MTTDEMMQRRPTAHFKQRNPPSVQEIVPAGEALNAYNHI
jgi:hypothetical protein